MPEYVYDCENCKLQSHIRHAYRATGIVCLHCGSDKMIKNLSTPFQQGVKAHNQSTKIGDDVKKAIVENSDELKQVKKKISNRVYKSK
jgi:DNA-directed RNA polymerase subunit RPC12/RpoP